MPLRLPHGHATTDTGRAGRFTGRPRDVHIDHDARSLELIARSFNGVAEGLTRDDVLDNITLFWLTNTGVSAARLYREYKLGFFVPKGVKIPVRRGSPPRR